MSFFMGMEMVKNILVLMMMMETLFRTMMIILMLMMMTPGMRCPVHGRGCRDRHQERKRSELGSDTEALQRLPMVTMVLELKDNHLHCDTCDTCDS